MHKTNLLSTSFGKKIGIFCIGAESAIYWQSITGNFCKSAQIKKLKKTSKITYSILGRCNVIEILNKP